MKTSKTPDKLASNASKLHKHIGQLLTNCDLFKNYEIRQEYRVSDVNPNYKSNREKFDWVIIGMNIAIECMGVQHEKPQRFGGPKDDETTNRKFIQQKTRDEEKKQAAEEAGWGYVIVTYKEENITEDELLEKIRIALAEILVKKSLDSMIEIIKKGKENKPTKLKTKIHNSNNWPKRKVKIQSRPFPKKAK